MVPPHQGKQGTKLPWFPPNSAHQNWCSSKMWLRYSSGNAHSGENPQPPPTSLDSKTQTNPIKWQRPVSLEAMARRLWNIRSQVTVRRTWIFPKRTLYIKRVCEPIKRQTDVSCVQHKSFAYIYKYVCVHTYEYICIYLYAYIYVYTYMYNQFWS